MRIFLTGANGFIGSAVALAFTAVGHRVRGLVRDEAKADTISAHGIEPVLGSLDDAAVLEAEARAADAVINTASSDHRGAVETLIAALSGSGKPLIHSSGTSIVADLAMGEPSDRIFDEATPIKPLPERAARVAIDRSGGTLQRDDLRRCAGTAGAERPNSCTCAASKSIRRGAVLSLLAAIAHHYARRAEAMAGDQIQELVPIETGLEGSRFEV
jgi:NAD(P)-dependent dehydrogenase (short-subunit alcohol dehydrogenase family)